jgi:agmatinase
MTVDDVGARLTTTKLADAARSPDERGPDSVVAPRTLYGAPACGDIDRLDAQVAFLGVPFDLGAAFGGARAAPDAFRDIRGVYAYGGGDDVPQGYYDLDSNRQRLAGVTMADCGNVVIFPSDVERNFARITRTVRRIVARDAVLVTIGGDHSITPALVRGFERFGAVDIVQFDAHHDYLDQHEGIRWSNGMAIRRCAELPWVRNITHVGLRMLPRDRRPIDDARKRGNGVITADQFRELGAAEAMARVPESDALYITIDIDVLDPSVCPGTAAPEPGGLSFYEMRSALRALSRRGRVVGVDIVEVAPNLDATGLTTKTASRLLVELLADIFDA